MAKRTIVRGSSEHKNLVRGGWLVVAAIALALPFVTTDFRTFQFTLALIWAVAVLGLNLLTGYSGQISLGHSAFFGIGAYASTILIVDYDWHYLFTLVPAAVLCFFLGFLFGIPALRLQGLYLALLTLGLAIAFPPILRRFESVTGGVQGMSVPSRRMAAPEWTGMSNDTYRYFLVLIVATALFWLARNLVNSRVGRTLVAIRDNEIPAQTMGIHLARYKTLVFAISAMYAGIAGVLYTYVIRFVAPGSFLILMAIGFLAAMVVGGLATVQGAIFGGLFIQFVPFYAEEVSQGLAEFIYGAIIIIVMLLMPGGFVELVRRIRNRVVNVIDPPLLPPERSRAGAPTEPARPAVEAY
jgi:branched-chain amino acid transport system permease protein